MAVSVLAVTSLNTSRMSASNVGLSSILPFSARNLISSLPVTTALGVSTTGLLKGTKCLSTGWYLCHVSVTVSYTYKGLSNFLATFTVVLAPPYTVALPSLIGATT